MGRPKVKTPKVQPTLMKVTEDYNPEEIRTSEMKKIRRRKGYESTLLTGALVPKI